MGGGYACYIKLKSSIVVLWNLNINILAFKLRYIQVIFK